MFAATDWSNLTVAGAFLVGAVLGTIGTIRILRYLLEYLRNERTSEDAEAHDLRGPTHHD